MSGLIPSSSRWPGPLTSKAWRKNHGEARQGAGVRRERSHPLAQCSIERNVPHHRWLRQAVGGPSRSSDLEASATPRWDEVCRAVHAVTRSIPENHHSAVAGVVCSSGERIDMRIIVTGSNGFIGWHTCKRLVEQGVEVVGVDDLSEGTADNAVTGVRYHALSVADAGKMVHLMREFRPDAVIHLAARPRVRFTVEHPLQSATSNLLGTVAVLDSLLRADLVGKTRLVFASSSAVYGSTDVLPTPETHPCRPESPYGLQKYQCEQWCHMFHRLYGLDVAILRYFNAFGPGAAFGGAYSLVLSAWLYHVFVDPSYRPYLEGDGTQTRDFCYVDDIAWANVTAATRTGGFTGEVMNIAQGRAYSLREAKSMLEEIAGSQLDLERRPPRTGDVQHTLADISRAQKELGYTPSTDFRAQLQSMASWFRRSHPRTGHLT